MHLAALVSVPHSSKSSQSVSIPPNAQPFVNADGAKRINVLDKLVVVGQEVKVNTVC